MHSIDSIVTQITSPPCGAAAAAHVGGMQASECVEFFGVRPLAEEKTKPTERAIKRPLTYAHL